MRKRARVRGKKKDKKAKGGQAGDTLGGCVSGKQRMPNVFTRANECFIGMSWPWRGRGREGGGEGERERGGEG